MNIIANIGLGDGIGLDDVFFMAAGVASVIGALRLMLGGILKRTTQFLDWQDRFQRDWEGEPAVPGRDAVPGVMERLNAIDGEFKRNGGSTLKDQIVRTSESVERLAEQVAIIESRQLEIAERLDGHARTLENHLHGPGRSGLDPAL